MAGVIQRRIESAAVVSDGQTDPPALDAKHNPGLRRAGMTHYVVDRLLEDEEDLPPEFRAHLQFLIRSRAFEFEMQVPGGEDIAREAPHPVNEISNMVPFRVDGPNDVAHGVNQFTRDGTDIRQMLWELRIRSCVPARDLA